MTTSTISSGALGVLASINAQTSQLTQQENLQNISRDLQNQMNRQIAALQPPVDTVSIGVSQAQLKTLQAQQSQISSIGTQYGSNGNILADLSTQLATLNTAITNGNSSAFDTALNNANTDITDLQVVKFNPIFSNDGVVSLKQNGLGINSSASYNLSTPTGQSAAQAAVAAAQVVVERVQSATGANRTLASSQDLALNNQVQALQNYISSAQSENATAIAAQKAQLQTNEQNTVQVIQLNMGNGTDLASALNAAMNPAQPVNSLFGALSAAVGQTGKSATSTQNQPAAVLSLFA